MNQTEIDTVLQWVNEQLHAGYPLTAEEINRAFTALQARVDEQHSQLIGASVVADRLADQRDEARTQLAAAQAEVARVTKERDALANANHRQAHALQLTAQALGPDYSFACDALPKAAKHVATQLATLRAAIAEAVRRADEYNGDAEVYPVSSWIARPLYNLTKPEGEGSDPDEGLPTAAEVRGILAPDATQPEGEDALVEALSHCDGIGTFNRCGDREVVLTFADHESGMKAFEALEALASRGLVRGEGVEP